MTEYADYQFYVCAYLCGKEAVINPVSFSHYARMASQELVKATFGNITTVTDEIKMCCCELAEAISNAETQSAASAGKSSERVGEYSVGYTNPIDITAKLNADIRRIIRKWLGTTGLLYAGVC